MWQEGSTSLFLITLKKLNAINIVFPHVYILPSQTKHKFKKVMMHIKSHV
jgi:hypothetical protein